MEFFIKGNVPALKNGKQWTGKYLVSNKRVSEYLKLHGIKKYSSRKKEVFHFEKSETDFEFLNQCKLIKEELKHKTPPYKIGFYFIRSSKHKFDFGNAVELISDLFTAYNVWEDDNMDFLLPFPLEKEGIYYHVDKENSGVIIKIF